LDLFPQTRRAERKTGILPSQEIRELIANGKIRCLTEIPDDQIQPASIDLRLGTIAYRVQASFLPGRSATLRNKIEELKIAEYDLSRPTLLETNAVYVVPLLESLALPRDIGGKANPKSTTGRLDIFTRLITDGGLEFEHVLKGYGGDLYVEIVPRTFPIIVTAGTKLNQLRFIRGNPPSTDGVLEQLAEREQLVYYENGEGPAEAVIESGLRKISLRKDLRSPARLDFGAEFGEKFCQRLRPNVALTVMPHGNAARLGFFAAHHGHVGNFLQLRIADLGLQFFVAIIERGAESGGAEFGNHALGIV